MARFFRLVWWWVVLLWALPLSLVGLGAVGLLLAMGYRDIIHFWPRGEAWAFSLDRPFPGPWRPFNGITLGWVVLLAPGHTAQNIKHEMVHVAQCRLLGPLAILAYPLASLWAWARGGRIYKDNFFERQARRRAGQEV